MASATGGLTSRAASGRLRWRAEPVPQPPARGAPCTATPARVTAPAVACQARVHCTQVSTSGTVAAPSGAVIPIPLDITFAAVGAAGATTTVGLANVAAAPPSNIVLDAEGRAVAAGDATLDRHAEMALERPDVVEGPAEEEELPEADQRDHSVKQVGSRPPHVDLQ